MAARREEMFDFMGESERSVGAALAERFCVMFAAFTPRTRLTKTEGQALDNIAPGPIMHDDQLL